MKTILNALKRRNKKVIIGGGSILFLLVFGVFLKPLSQDKLPSDLRPKDAVTKKLAKSGAQDDPFKAKISDALSVIDKRISLVQKEMERASSQNKNKKGSMALKQLSQTIVGFKQQAEKSLLKSHEENEALAKKISALEEVITSLKGEKNPLQYLDKKALPFEVMAIDSVNEEAILAIKYNYNHVALEKGDKLAGWKVIALDYGRQSAEFDDEKGAHVVLSLKENLKEEKSWV